MNSGNKPTLSTHEIDSLLHNYFGSEMSGERFPELAAWGKLEYDARGAKQFDYMECLHLLVSRPPKHQSRSKKPFTMDELRDGIFDEQTIE